MKGLYRCGAIFCCCFALAGFGAESVEDARRLLGGQQYAEAESALRSILSEDPRNGDAAALLGISLYHQGRAGEAVEPLERARESGTTLESRALYYLGVIYAATGRQTESSDRFSELLIRFPASPESARIGGGLLAETEPADERRGIDFRGTLLSIEAGVDSNPDLSDEGDADLVMSAYASSDIAIEGLPVSVGASAYLEKYADQTENDFLYLAADVRRAWLLSDAATLDGSVELSHSWLEFDGYERKVDLIADWHQVWDAQWQTRVRGDIGLISAVDDGSSDGTRAGVRIRGYRDLGREGMSRRLRLQAALHQDDRDRDYDGYDRILLGAEWRLKIVHDIMLDLGIDFESRAYASTDPFFGVTRDDDVVDFSAYATKPLDESKALTAQLVYTSRDSNVGFYNADELLLTVGLLILP